MLLRTVTLEEGITSIPTLLQQPMSKLQVTSSYRCSGTSCSQTLSLFPTTPISKDLSNVPFLSPPISLWPFPFATPPPPRTCFSSTYDVAGQGQTPRTPHRPAEKVGRKSVPGFGQGTVCRTATKSKHCPGRKYTLSVLLSNKGVNEKSLSQLMTSGEHGQRYQLPSTGAPGRKKKILFSQYPWGKCLTSLLKRSLIAYLFL